MGSRRIEPAVVDAGPLIHLAEIDCLSLLNNFEVLHVPQAVWTETVGQNRISQNDLLPLSNIERQYPAATTVAQFIQDNDLEMLHTGECESLYVCRKMNISHILTDDLAVRTAAKKLAIRPVGSLGIVISAFQKDHISLEKAEKFILDLQDISSLFVTRTIVELAVENLHRSLKAG